MDEGSGSQESHKNIDRGEQVKQEIDANRQGVVWFRDERVAEWGGTSPRRLHEANRCMLEHEAAFLTLMERKPKE